MNALRTGIVLGVVMILAQACASTAVEKATDADDDTMSEYVAQADLSAQQRFREVLNLLEDGEPGAARVELLIYLEENPDSNIARDLLSQIDLPSLDYFPEDFEEVQLASGQSLSTLSKQYLGSLYQFYALAKYNGIGKPRSIKVGQMIKIPLTVNAREVFAGEHEDVGPAISSTAPIPPTEPSPEEQPNESVAPSEELLADQADDLYRRAVNAFRAQDLDSAIALWDKVLDIDPDYENVILQRSQAIELKKKLSSLN